MFHKFVDPTYVVRRFDADGNLLREYPMISNYWFPSLPVFPQGAGDSGAVVEVTAADPDEIGNLYSISGALVRAGVRADQRAGLPRGFYIWKKLRSDRKRP